MNSQEGVQDFPGEYRLDVEDFGPIVKASVDLRPLTVFIGPSNTGKSYLAILMYALHQCFGQGRVGPYGWRPRYHDQLLRSLARPLLEDDEKNSPLLDQFRYWLSQESSNKSQPRLPIDIDPHVTSLSGWKELEVGSRSALPNDVDSYIRSVLEQAEGFGLYAESEIGRCFGVDNLTSLVRRSSSGLGTKVEISIPRTAGAGMAQYQLRLHEGGVEFSGEISGARSLSNEIEQLGDPDDASSYLRRLSPRRRVDDYEDLGFSLAHMAQDMFMSLLRPLYRNAYYLPADRTGVMHSHQVVVSTLVQSATTAGLHPSVSIPLLSGVLADFLSQLIEMSGELGRVAPRPTDQLAERLEHDVLKGAVLLKHAESGYPTFEYLPNGWDENLPLMRASSMVSELAPVVLYLRHLVRPGDILIIEEPESHLHPAMQAEFTRQLAAVVRAGVRVIVTTHSEWLLEELANLVRLSQVPEAERKGIVGGDVALDADQVGAWLFKPDESGGGSTVEEIGLDESGLYPSGFEEVAAALHNKWAAISSRLGDDE